MPFQVLPSGTRIYYLDENQTADQVVLLLHGLGVNSSSWLLQIPALVSIQKRVITPDTRGFGQSSYTGGSVSPKQAAEDIAALLKILSVQRAEVVGISMGGTQALQLALDYPALVQKLVLINTFAALRPNQAGIWFYFLLRLFLVHFVGLEKQAELVTKRMFPNPKHETLRQELYRQILQANPAAYRSAIRNLGRFDVRKRLAEITCPTLIVTSERDTTVPPENQRQLIRGIRDAQQVSISDAGHAVTGEQPEIINSYLQQFLAGDQLPGS